MNEQPDLIQTTPSAPPALTAARAALAAAQDDLAALETAGGDDTGIATDYAEKRLNAAATVVARIEAAEARGTRNATPSRHEHD